MNSPSTLVLKSSFPGEREREREREGRGGEGRREGKRERGEEGKRGEILMNNQQDLPLGK